jgi:ubiquinone/menaquinone biosynthesis C-methylase UbiE
MKLEHAFTNVDAQSNPEEWIRVLDKVRQEPLYAAYKQRAVQLLDAHAGWRYLEVGTGTGEDALAFAAGFGTSVVGVDSSSVMVEEARRRGLTEAVVADAHTLPFEDASFDGAWADRTFQHLADPVAALAEMVRVVRTGGRVVVVDPDYGTQIVDVPDQDLARRVLRFRSDFGIRNGTLARQMPGLFGRAGLTNLQVEAVPIVLRDPTALDNALGLRDWASFAHEQGIVEAEEVPAWEAALDHAAANGSFLYSFSLFITAGRKAPRTT